MSITARSLLNQLSEIPHLMIAVGMGKELFVHCDLVRRRDAVADTDYFDKYYLQIFLPQS